MGKSVDTEPTRARDRSASRTPKEDLGGRERVTGRERESRGRERKGTRSPPRLSSLPSPSRRHDGGRQSLRDDKDHDRKRLTEERRRSPNSKRSRYDEGRSERGHGHENGNRGHDHSRTGGRVGYDSSRSSGASSPSKTRHREYEHFDRRFNYGGTSSNDGRERRSMTRRSKSRGPHDSNSRRSSRCDEGQGRASSLATTSTSSSRHSLRTHSTSRLDTMTENQNRPTGSKTSSEDELDNLKVEKWVRSAPDEIYYTRADNGEFLSTDATKNLCTMFEKDLLTRAERLRLEAEKLGKEKFEELTREEEEERRLQKELRRLKREKKKNASCAKESPECCAHSCDKEPSTLNEEKATNSTDDKEKTKGGLNEIPTCVHEEGEICDCAENVVSEDNSTAKGEQSPKACTPTENGHSHSHSTCPASTAEESGKKQLASKNCGHSHSASASCTSNDSSSDSDSSDSDSGEDVSSRSGAANRELEKRKMHPRRLHTELWHNDPGLMNDGPVCRCSAKARRCGIRHGYYAGEGNIPICDPFSTNKSNLFHYRITISPPKNFLVKTPSVISHDDHEYIFEGFSLFSHSKIDLKLPPCRVIRFNIRYDIFVAEEKFPESFCVKELQLFETYLFREILELLDLKFDWSEQQSCSPFHLMPRFVRQLPDNGKEILSMNRVMIHLLKSDREIFKEEELVNHYTATQEEWQKLADKHKGMIVTKFGQKPCSIRVDQIDRDVSGHEKESEGIPYPLLVHFGIRPPQLSYAGNANYQRAWRRYVKYRHLLSNMAKPSAEEKRKLAKKEMELQEMRTASSMKRDVTVAISAKEFRTTGIFCDLIQHAMLIPVLVAHLRFHKSLSTLETTMEYNFKSRYLLQLAMTHPSYRENFGTNPDHARNSLTNCGIRHPEYGDRRIHYASTRKRGITTLINIMAKFGSDQEMESEITHNERLEFLGDAVVEFVTSIHLFHLFPDLEEGGLATYRAAIVQNQHLAVLAKTLNLDSYMLYAHGSDLCHDSELRHAMANCFEALMGALFLDGAIQISDRVFAHTLFKDDGELLNQWVHYPPHPLQLEAGGDRDWIKTHLVLQKLTEFEEQIGIEFTHIRLLARAFTDRSLGYNNLSCGSNQRMEFLGDTVLQLISSEYLYRHFPDHHEGHLSLLRSSLVNNRTQAVVCDDLGMAKYAMRADPRSEMKTKDRADLLEAVLGALYIDKGLMYCTTFCSVCFFPRLNKSIVKQEWNDPKSKLQQCCLTLRAMDGREPDIPVYKVIESLGPTNTRVYTVAVYFRGQRLATAKGHSIQEAEMHSAALALKESGHLFPQLHHQKSVVDKTSRRQRLRRR